MALEDILFAVFYIAAIIVVILHYTGWLEDHDLNWVVYVMAVATFPVIFLL